MATEIIELRVPKDVACFIAQLAIDADVTPDQAASVLVVLALRRYLPTPPEASDAE